MCRHILVLDAFTTVSQQMECDRFVSLVLPLFREDLPHLQASCLSLLNALIQPPDNSDNVDFRTHIRNEIMRNGMHDAIEVRVAMIYTPSIYVQGLRNSDHAGVQCQMSIFDEQLENDADIYYDRFDG